MDEYGQLEVESQLLGLEGFIEGSFIVLELSPDVEAAKRAKEAILADLERRNKKIMQLIDER